MRRLARVEGPAEGGEGGHSRRASARIAPPRSSRGDDASRRGALRAAAGMCSQSLLSHCPGGVRPGRKCGGGEQESPQANRGSRTRWGGWPHPPLQLRNQKAHGRFVAGKKSCFSPPFFFPRSTRPQVKPPTRTQNSLSVRRPRHDVVGVRGIHELVELLRERRRCHFLNRGLPGFSVPGPRAEGVLGVIRVGGRYTARRPLLVVAVDGETRTGTGERGREIRRESE